MNGFTVIGVVGPPASGKSCVTSRLEELGAERVRMGDVIWNEVENRDMEVNEESVGKVANLMREEKGMDAVAKESIPLIREVGEEADFVVVDGIRGIAEVEKFREVFAEDFFLIAVEASAMTRYERMKRREREDDIDDFDSFKEKDEREYGWGLREAMEDADFGIKNEGTLRELKKKTEDIFERVKDRHENQD